MSGSQGKFDGTEQASKSFPAVSASSISLPKGGGAIRGIGEKFAANPVTGTGSMSVPIATSPGRSGFGPQLSLSYDSGSGNGPFGVGWNLSLPAITRKTDKGLPQYRDAEESDVYILSGTEDLVPVLQADDTKFKDEVTAPGYVIHRYRPRIEGLFARIERWTKLATGEIHWRSITRDNVTTQYGRDNNSRIFDPAESDTAHPKRIFSWLISQSYDDKGNAVVYEYQNEDSQRIFEDSHGRIIPLPQERNRTEATRSANRYVKRIKYGNRIPNRDLNTWKQTEPTDLPADSWMFEVVFDYEEGHYTEDAPDGEGRIFAYTQITSPAASRWPARQDPFSSYRGGFEVRTYRLCRRVLMFHHFPQELGINDCLVRSTEFAYCESPVASFLSSVTQSGYVRQPTENQPNRYLKETLPALEFEYSHVPTAEELAELKIQEPDSESLQNLPVGLDSSAYQWMDLDAEGTSGIITEQAECWHYKRNLSASNIVPCDGLQHAVAQFSVAEVVTPKPGVSLHAGAQFLDLAADGRVDLVQMEGPVKGFYERTDDGGWSPFKTFTSWPALNLRDSDLRFVDLTGDGHSDILITEGEALTWYPSLAEEGFGPAVRVSLPPDDETGPRLVFDDGTQSIYLADLSGDGLSDLVRIRNGEVCYWPNLGYGLFGRKVLMDNAPRFDDSDQFDQRRIRLADTDGSGTTDILYVGHEGVQIYFNQSGNRWSDVVVLPQFPSVNNLSSVQVIDLLGNGTACLAWSSSLPDSAGVPMRYIALMDEKPHLLVKIKNNLGAETRLRYAPSTKFYLEDKRAGKPWITRLPFPVHVVERVETYDHISHNYFVNRYAYHHGHFDGFEREFRGFGMVEQWDTEELAALSASAVVSQLNNLDATSYVPPALTKTWFHTGVYVGREHTSDFFAGLLDSNDQGEYHREPGLTDDEARAMLLPDTVLPPDLTTEEAREACRALKGAMLRQEIYAVDGTNKEKYPFAVTEQNFTIETLQRQGLNRHAVFLTHPREAITYHYERKPADPRVQHALTLEVDSFGNVLKSAVVGYGRRRPDTSLVEEDQEKQAEGLVTYTQNRLTNAIDSAADYRAPLLAETSTYELTGYAPGDPTRRFVISDFVKPDPVDAQHVIHIFDTEIPYELQPSSGRQRRLIECVRTCYRRDDLKGLLPLGELETLAIQCEAYKLAFTPGLLAQVFQRNGQALLPYPAKVLGGKGADSGGYVDLDGNGHWWIPSGRAFLSPKNDDTAPEELAYARQHFFLLHRYRDAFHTDAVSTESIVTYDDYDLMMLETRDALGNRITAGELRLDGTIDPTNRGNDYRVLQPCLLMDPNRNRSAVAFNALGMVVGTAIMGKPLPAPLEGDTLSGFATDLTQNQTDAFFDADDPHAAAPLLLQAATTRIVYDLDRFVRTWQAHPNDQTKWQPAYAATLARETHASDPLPPHGLRIQISFSYSDGFGREIQKKIQAEPGPLVEGSSVVNQRWVASGWTIYNNKGKPVRQYEPFFSKRQWPDGTLSSDHRFEFGVKVGVSPVLFYDPAERIVATLHPNHTYEKVVFDPWQQMTFDVNDTCAPRNQQTGDPRTDPDIGSYVGEYFKAQPATWQTWRGQRIGGERGQEERNAALRAEAHADTPTTAHFDALGRPFLTVARNRVVCAGHDLDGTEDSFATRVELDIEGNQRAVRDERKLPINYLPTGVLEQRIVMHYAYDMLGNRIHQLSMEAGARWMLNDVAGKPILTWDSRGHNFATSYDVLRRPVQQSVRGTSAESDPRTLNRDVLVDKIEYGESPLSAPPAEEDRAQRLNLRTRIYRHFDSAGIASNARLDANGTAVAAYDFKGNLLHSTRRLVSDYTAIPDWLLNPQLDLETFEGSTSYDALNRPIQSVAPHSNQARAKRNVIQPVFNEANLLERVDVWLGRAAEPGALLDPDAEAPSRVGVVNIDYDAKAQRLRIDYKNGASTRYRYDPETLQLVDLYTRRGAAFIEDCDNPQPPPATIAAPECPPQSKACGLQKLHYTYDPAGNIIYIEDKAQQAIYFRNKIVEPSNDYVYDALYRLIQATGREHLGQGGAPSAHSHDDAGRVGLLTAEAAGCFAPNDGNAMGTYIERYVYDAVGNFLQMQHRGSDPAHPGWTRAYDYLEPSLIEDGSGGVPLKTDNQLTRTTLSPNGPNPQMEPYQHGGHGNIVRMPHLGGGSARPNMHWDFRNQLRQTDMGGGGVAFYVYDASGQRVRKVWEKAPGLIEERIYLGGFEIFRKHSGPISANTATLERETLHVRDDNQRIAFAEMRTLDTAGNDQAPRQLLRYQFGNHLGSASLELDEQARIISYEEYAPYGSSTYQAVRSQTETAKQYRYTGKERDEESGFYYHGARYYASWLGRWTSCDPAGMEAGPNLYLYVVSNPITYFDPSGHDKVDKFKGCYVATFDSLILGKRTSLFFHSDSFSAGYKTCYWSDRLRERVDQSDVARTIRNDVVNTEASARLIGAVLGLMSAFVPNAPDGSDLPPVIQDEYRKFRFASTMATIVVGGAEGLKSRPPGSPSAPTPALSLAGNATVGSANAAAIVRSEAISPALVASSSLSNLNANMVRPRKERDAPAKPASDKPPKGKSTAPKAPLSDKQLHRIEIQEAIKEFEASGGQIEKIHSQPHLHHLLPQELRGKFEKLQLDIEKFKIWLDPKVHLEHVHGGAPEGGLWNQTWKEFFTQNPNATVTQVKDQLARMRRSFGI